MSGPRTLPERAFRQRARLVAVLFCAVAAGLAFRLFWLQLRASDWYTQRALGQQLRDTIVPADRGRIYSADGVLLAANSSCWTLRASPREMPEEKITLAAHGLAEILALDEAALLEKFSDRRSNDCLLRYRVDRAAADAVRDFCEENSITGIRINQDSKRWYPQGAFLASVLGFTNVDNAGVAGLELKYDDLLTGENGVVLTAVNAWGYTLEQSYETERFPTEGDGLRLTIDSCIQHYLENALSYAVQEHHVAARAVGIVMDVNTGAVLAMSTTPSYDPNEPRVIADTAARNTVEALTGDARKVGEGVARELGLDDVKTELLPQDKLEEVEKLKTELDGQDKLAFVGDGLNDTPVLAQSDVGIAMGALGSDAAVEAADVVLMSDEPSAIVRVMKIARRTKRIVWENISFALGVKAVCLLLGALGIAGMWQAVFADVGVTVIAVLNSLRVLYGTSKRA